MYAKLLWVYHFKKQRFMRQWSVWPQDMLRISPGNVECPLGCSLLLEIQTIHTYWCWECCSYPVYSKIKSLNHDWKATGIFCFICPLLYLFEWTLTPKSWCFDWLGTVRCHIKDLTEIIIITRTKVANTRYFDPNASCLFMDQEWCLERK